MDEKDMQQFVKDSFQRTQELTGIVEDKLAEKYGGIFSTRKLRINEGDQSITWTVMAEKSRNLLFSARISKNGEMTDTYVSRRFMRELEEQISDVLAAAGLHATIRALPDSEEGILSDLTLSLNEYLSVRQVTWIHLAIVIETGAASVERAVPVIRQLCMPLGVEVTADIRGCSTTTIETHKKVFEENINISTALLDRYGTENRFFDQIIQQQETHQKEEI